MSQLATQDLTVRFGGHVAVNGVTCSFEPGTLTAIVGPNGAGKTTYFNLISGQLKATSGTVTLGGRELSGASASERTRAGLGRAFRSGGRCAGACTARGRRVARSGVRRLRCVGRLDAVPGDIGPCRTAGRRTIWRARRHARDRFNRRC